MNETVNIGRTIARERRRAGVTQEALAAHLGVSKAAVSKWELGQSLPDVSLLPRIAAYFSLTLDELFGWRGELAEEESAALYAEVYVLEERDLSAAHERLRMLAAEHYADANLLIMLASLLTVWAGGMATPFHPVGEKGIEPDVALDSDTLTDEALALLDRAFEVASDPAALFLARQQKATALFQAGRHEEAAGFSSRLCAVRTQAPRRCSWPRHTERPAAMTRPSGSCRRSVCARRDSCSRRSCRRWACETTPRSPMLPARPPGRFSERWTWAR